MVWSLVTLEATAPDARYLQMYVLCIMMAAPWLSRDELHGENGSFKTLKRPTDRKEMKNIALLAGGLNSQNMNSYEPFDFLFNFEQFQQM